MSCARHAPLKTSQDASKPATVDNLVLLTHAEADQHDQLPPGGLAQLRAQVRAHRGWWRRPSAGQPVARLPLTLLPARPAGAGAVRARGGGAGASPPRLLVAPLSACLQRTACALSEQLLVLISCTVIN